MKSGMPIDSTLQTLSTLEFPLKTGVIISLAVEFTIDQTWLRSLLDRLKQIAHRFEYIEPFFTTHEPVENYLTPERLYALQMFNAPTAYKLQQLGLKDVDMIGIHFNIIREETRILLKHLNCKYVSWLDADMGPPPDMPSKLIKAVENGADLAAGWCFDRHYPFERVNIELSTQPMAKTQEEIEYYDMANNFMKRMCEIVIDHLGKATGIYNWQVGKSHLPTPSKLQREKEMIEIRQVGFGCVVMKKEVSDRASFFDFSGVGGSEDYDFCNNARKAGYKLFVDPTCYCEHGHEC
jgi:hypothetical protein